MSFKISALCVKSFRTGTSLFKRCGSFYPIDDSIFGLDEDQQQLRKSVFELVQQELAPHAQEIDRVDSFENIRKFWKQLGDNCFLGVTACREYGGTQKTYLDHVIIMEEIARACGGIGVAYAAHSSLCINQINRNGNEELKQKYLPKLCSGEHIGGLAMTEANAGSDVLSMELKAELKDDFYILNGEKCWVTNGLIADILVVFAKTDPSAKKRGITAFIVENKFEGFSIGDKYDKLGMRGSNTTTINFKDCKVPAKNILGKENEGVNILMSELDYERLLLAAGPVGLMQAACDIAFEYAHQRKQFGTRVGEFQLIQGKMADMHTALSACRSYLYGVARSATCACKVSSKDCAGIALIAGEKSTKVALDAVQILGGYGYGNSCPAARILRDAKLTEIGGGTSEIRRMVIGRSLNKEYNKN